MPVTILTKVSLPKNADVEAFKELGLCKAFGVLLPASQGGEAANAKLVAAYGKAGKFEEELLAKCNAAKSDKKSFRAISKTYFSNKRCLLVALFEDNKRQSLERRMSLEELIALSGKYDILKDLSEPARVWQQPKGSGKGMRVVCSFGPVARAAQLMVKKLLSLTYEPKSFQYAKLHFSKKVQLAITVINEKGYPYVNEIDIKDFFPSFEKEALVDALPLPKEATRQIVLSKGAAWYPHPKYTQYGYIPSPPGIPQGSASSAAVAEWCIANMPLESLNGSTVINHADNFFAASASSDDAIGASKALSSGIAGLPGGDFQGEMEQATTVEAGFRMLGCHISASQDGELRAFPTEANLKKLRETAGRQRQRAYGRLTAATQSNSKLLRFRGLQDYLRFESIWRGWLGAFAFCGPMIKSVEDHYRGDTARLRHTFEITDEELKPLQDDSTEIAVSWYSGG